MTARIEHPNGLQPPEEWWTQQNGHAKADEFREWLEMSKPREKKRSKFNAKRGFYADLGHFAESMLEANTERLLRFKGHEPWTDKTATPTAEGKWVAYELRRFKFTLRPGKDSERTVNYLPDFLIWDNGRLSIWECKGKIDQRAERNERLMRTHHPDIPYEVITISILEGLALEAMKEDRRHGGTGRIPHWDEGPKPKESA